MKGIIRETVDKMTMTTSSVVWWKECDWELVEVGPLQGLSYTLTNQFFSNQIRVSYIGMTETPQERYREIHFLLMLLIFSKHLFGWSVFRA